MAIFRRPDDLYSIVQFVVFREPIRIEKHTCCQYSRDDVGSSIEGGAAGCLHCSDGKLELNVCWSEREPHYLYLSTAAQ